MTSTGLVRAYSVISKPKHFCIIFAETSPVIQYSSQLQANSSLNTDAFYFKQYCTVCLNDLKYIIAFY